MKWPSWLTFKVQESPKSRALDIGWFLDTDKASVIWEAPKRVKRDDPTPTHAKSVNYCPAALDHEARMFEVPCPIDVRLRFRWDDKQQPVLTNVDGDQATIRPKHLGQMVALVNRREWRHPDRPIVQLVTPYVFVADETAYMTQMPTIGWYNPNPLPGILIGGRFPAHIWPRQMMWAFEWYDIKQDIILKRGDPWFYVRFEAQDPSRPVRVFETEVTSELKTYVQSISAVSNYVDKTFSLFKTAAARRPKTLLRRKQKA